MCKVFPSSLGSTALRWFNGLRRGSIYNFVELIQEFRIRFVTCSWEPQPIDALLSMKMKVGETLRSYAGQYWELYNEIGGGNEKIAAGTFRMGLPEDSGLRESLTKKPPEDMRQLMRCIEEYKWLEHDRLQSKGKAPAINHPRQNIYPPRIRGNLRIQEPDARVGEVNLTFKELVHRMVDKIKHELYFRWPNQMGGDPSRRNQNLYYTYHKDKGHKTKQCQVLRDHLGWLVKAGHLKEFVTDSSDRRAGQGTPQRGNPLPPPLWDNRGYPRCPEGPHCDRGERGVDCGVSGRKFGHASTGKEDKNHLRANRLRQQRFGRDGPTTRRRIDSHGSGRQLRCEEKNDRPGKRG
ncbi:uncharacterized protein LOC136065214 [Quercus suber]|uniref:uncharacterized protein LOC136065214 n=1 Tax=Quercus suber TaxID=58331 RepID=UPI0032DED2E7